MTITALHLRHCIDNAKDITDQYRRYVLEGDRARKSIDKLLEVCSTYLETRIDVYEVDMPQDGPTKAVYVAYEDHCDIFIRSGLTPEWVRFVLCKELFHIVIDKDDCRSLELFDDVLALQLPVIASARSNGSAWETLAEVSAMEFLFPFSDRQKIIANGGEINYTALATQYGLPLVYMESYLSREGMEAFEAFRID